MRSEQINLHESTAEEADADHEEPAGDGTEAVDDISKREQKVVLSKPAIRGVKRTIVRSGLLVDLLRVDLVDGLRGHGGRVQVDSVEGSGGALLTKLGLGHLEVPDRRSTGTPGRAKNLVLFAVQLTEVRGGRIGGEQKHGFLNRRVISDYCYGFQVSATPFSRVCLH